jgi:chromosome partitioning protein
MAAREKPMHTISVVGAKGGTLKTASVAALADLLAARGERVLMVDADPQADLTSRSGHARVPDPLDAPPVEVRFRDSAPQPLLLLRGGRPMEAADIHAVGALLGRGATHGPSLVLVDTPPALGPATTAAIRRSDLVLIPAVPGKESLERIHDILAVARAQGDPPVRLVITLGRTRSRLLQWMREQLDAYYPGLRLPHEIPAEVAAAEAALYELPVTFYAPRSRSAEGYRGVVDELVRQVPLRTSGPAAT